MYFGTHEEEIHIDKTAFELFCALKSCNEFTFLFESASDKDQKARFSFVGFAPREVITFKDGYYASSTTQTRTQEPLTFLQKEMGSSTSIIPGFAGGAVGYFSYEYINALENVPRAKDTLGFPDFEFGIFTDCLVYDHHTKKVFYRYTTKNRLKEILAALAMQISFKKLKITSKKCSKDKKTFCSDVMKLKNHILEGNIFQAVISKRYSFEYEGDLGVLYEKLKKTNPSPYLFYLSFGKRTIIGSSPENLIRTEQGKITSFATLAGTAKRGNTDKEDDELERMLLNDPKERAEHLMLVDLTRNDLGKVAVPGSVNMLTYMDIHKYSQVQHIASGISADLSPSKSCFDAFNAIFPAGTVSGAPKVRAMGIIADVEKETRGPYAGAVGYFSTNGNMDFAIGIRTFFAQDNILYAQTGAGVVYESEPKKEYEETEHKARALLNILGEEA